MSDNVNTVKNDRKQYIGNAILVFVAVIWGTAFAFQRAGMDHVEPITFNAVRMTLAAFSVGIVSIFQKKKDFSDEAEKKKYKKNTMIGGLLCGVFLATASTFQQIGLVYTTAGKAGFITALYILLVPVISFFVFKKKSSWIVWTAVIIGIAGMYLLCIKDGFRPEFGDSLVCVCAVLFSGHILCCDRFAKSGNPVRISAIQFAITALVSWIAAFVTENPNVEGIKAAALPIFYCGVISAGVGYTLQLVAQRFTKPVVASLIMSLESVFAVLGGAILLHERMSIREMAGCIVMFAAIIMVQLPVSQGDSSRS